MALATVQPTSCEGIDMSTGEANVWEPRKFIQVSADSKSVEELLIATASQTVFTLQTFRYTPGTGALTIHKNGLILNKDVDWTESTDSTFTLTNAAALDDELVAVGLTAIEGTVLIQGTFSGPDPTLVDATAAIRAGAVDPITEPHIAIGPTKIQAKANGTTAAALQINTDGGTVQIGDEDTNVFIGGVATGGSSNVVLRNASIQDANTNELLISTTPAEGGIKINNQETGGGLERVLTESDLTPKGQEDGNVNITLDVSFVGKFTELSNASTRVLTLNNSTIVGLSIDDEMTFWSPGTTASQVTISTPQTPVVLEYPAGDVSPKTKFVLRYVAVNTFLYIGPQ